MKILALIFPAVLLCRQPAQAQFSDRETSQAAQFFHEAKQASDKDHGQLWGRALYGPMVLVDPATHAALANEADSAHSFTDRNGVFAGKVPDDFGVANTSQNWQGRVWTIVRWPLPDDVFERRNLMMHELFHQLQQKTSLPKSDANCVHLDKFEGRLLLKLELAALKSAMASYPRINTQDLQNALIIRAWRYHQFTDADTSERSLEQNEGLAEFTGLMLSGRTPVQMKDYLVKSIDNFDRHPSFVRSMAYITGPAYGFLLSAKDPHWNKVFLQPHDLSQLTFINLVCRAYHFTMPSDIETRFNRIVDAGLYQYKEIAAVEQRREDARLQTLAINRKKFIDGPVLILPNVHMNFVFNPSEVQMIDGAGPVYPTFTGKADWGVLEVTSGGAFIKDWMYVYVPLPEGVALTGAAVAAPGWKLQLNSGWTIREGKRKGDYEVVKQ